MQKHKVNELQKLEKELTMWEEKAVEVESSRISSEKERKEELERMESSISQLKRENEEFKESVGRLRNEHHNLMQMRDKTSEEAVEERTLVLNDLKEKYNLLNSEVENISARCGQFEDPNFILQYLSNWDPFFLNKFLIDLNNQILEQ